MAIALDDAPVTLNRPLLDSETLAVTLRRGVGRAGVRLVGETAAYTVWIETSGIAVLQRDGAEQGRVPVAGDAQRVALTYASGTLSASVGAYTFPSISDGTAFTSLRAEFVVQGGNGQGSTFDEVTVPLHPGLVVNTTTPIDSVPQLLDNVDPAASLTVHYEQDFEDPIDPLIGLVGSDTRALVHTGDSYALLLNEGVYQVTGQVYDAIAIETEFALTTASLSLAVRDSGSGGYRAQISADGSVSLYRDGIAVQSALVTLPPELTLFRLTAVGSEIVLSVGTQTVLTWEDSEPLPLGSVIVAGTTAGTGAVIVDNLRLLSSPQTGALASAQSQSISGQAVYDLLMQPDERIIVSSGDGYALYQQGMAYPLTMPAELVAGVPKLSPDEQWLAFACRFPATDGAGICIARPNAIAATLQVLFQVFPDGMPPFQITTTFWNVYWSPNSDRLVYYEVTTTPVRSGEPDVGQQVGQIVIDTVAGTSIGNPTAIPDSSRCQGEIAWIDAERFTCYGHVHVTAGAYSIEPGIYAFDLTTDQVSLVTPVPPADLNTPVDVNRCRPMSARAATDHHWFACWTRTQILGQQSAFSYLRAFDILPPTAAITTVYTDTRWGFSPNWTYLSPDGATLWWTEGGANGVPTTYHPMIWTNGAWTPGSVIITTEATRIYQWEPCLTPDCALPSTLLLDLSLAPQVNPAALQVGDRIPVVVRVTNTGSTAVQANSTLSLTIPAGLTPTALTEATATLDLLTLLQNLIDNLIAWFGGLDGDYPFTFTRQPDAIDMQVDYPIPALGPFETEVFEITLEVRPEYAGTFTIAGTVTTEIPEAAPLELMTTQILSSTSIESTASANLVLQVNPPAQETGQCVSSVGGINVRSSTVVDPTTILLSNFAGFLYLDGIYDPDPLTSFPVWYHVIAYIQSGTSTQNPISAWVSSEPYQNQSPCNYPGYGNLTDLSAMDQNGTVIVPTATPSPVPTVTPAVTATPTAMPTLYPTLTPGPTPTLPPSFTLCDDRGQWLRDLCVQGWNYLTDAQRQQLIDAVNNSFVTTDFISLDAWWLQNIRRGITDVPPQVWQSESLAQCGTNIACTGIVQDSIFLFENMWRVGVDWANAGEGQIRYDLNRGALLENQELWFLESGDMSAIRNLNEYWGWLQDDGQPIDSWGFACDNLRQSFTIPLGFDTRADVCWVCQDVPTLLYERRGFSLRDIMPNYVNLISEGIPSGYNDAYYRNVPAVVEFASRYAPTYLLSGSDSNYRIGEMVFTSLDPIQTDSFGSYNHVGIVVRGVTTNMSFEQALDFVLVAQVSYSSQGYFSSSFEPTSLNLSPPTSGGRYEVITLRTYLIKHLLGAVVYTPPAAPPNVMNVNELLNGANVYLRHWAPPEL